jgi:hypothetical protein
LQRLGIAELSVADLLAWLNTGNRSDIVAR